MSQSYTDRYVVTDLPNGEARLECQRAVLEVMKVWPNESVTSEAMSARAAEFLHADGHDGTMARFALDEFIGQCRPQPTITRSDTFWKIVHGLFTRTEALELYLEQCCSLTSRGERHAITSHLRKNGYSRKEISTARKKLGNQKEGL